MLSSHLHPSALYKLPSSHGVPQSRDSVLRTSFAFLKIKSETHTLAILAIRKNCSRKAMNSKVSSSRTSSLRGILSSASGLQTLRLSKTELGGYASGWSRPEESIVLVAHGDRLKHTTSTAAVPSNHVWMNAETRIWEFGSESIETAGCWLYQREDVAAPGG